MIKVSVSILLTVVVPASAVSVIYSKHQTRVLFAEIQSLERKLDAHGLEWGRLQLELNTLASHERVESHAHDQLGMVIPKTVFSLTLAKP